jgi:hypothetical protein
MSDEFVDDAVFGRLRWDDKYTIFGDFEYAPGLRVGVVLDADFEEIDEEEVFGAARNSLACFRKNERQIRVLTAEVLQAHRQDTTLKLSDLDVANSLRIKELTFDEDGFLTVVWHGGELFPGRRVYTHVSASGKFAQAGVANG